MPSPKLLAALAAGLVLAVVLGYLYAYPPVTVSDVRYTYTGMAAGVFMKVRNLGLSEVCITGAMLEGVNALVELHETVKEDGAYRMRPVGEVCVPPLGEVELKPRGLHVMVMGGVDPGGETLVLILDDGREVRVDLPEEPVSPHG